MAVPEGGGHREFSCEELLGPLNAVEWKHAPKRLWASGRIELLRRPGRIAIVGSRKASESGLKRAARLATELTRHGVTIASGLAAGVDTFAHTASIEAGGDTIAVLGTAIDQSFPATNRDLQAKIASEHLCISQFAPGSRTYRGNFPQRNRTMALISEATVIVEASDRSGTIHQGWEAIRLGRPLFIMRSMAEDSRVSWPKELIAYGAIVLSDVDQILDAVPRDGDVRLRDVAF